MNQHWNTSIDKCIAPDDDPRITDIIIKLLKYEKKISKNKTAQEFTQWCLNEKIIPTYAKFSNQNLRGRSAKISTKIMRENLKLKIREMVSHKNLRGDARNILKLHTNEAQYNSILLNIEQQSHIFYAHFKTITNNKMHKLSNKQDKAEPTKNNFINLSKIKMPDEFCHILNQGLNNNIYPKNNAYNNFAAFQEIRQKASKICQNRKFSIKKRHHILFSIDQAVDKINHIKTKNNNIPALLTFLKSNNLIVTKSDKSDIAVVMDRNDYFIGLENNLNNESYVKLKESKRKTERNSLQKSIYDICRYPDHAVNGKPIHTKYISEKDFANISTINKGSERTALALEKTHKELENGKYKKRIIINNAGSASDKLEKYLYNTLKVVEEHMPTLLKSSNELLGRFLNFTAPDNYELISTDIKDMYSSIDPKNAIKCLIEFITKNKIVFDIPLNNIKNLLSDCILKCSSFKLNNKYYKQK